MYTLYHAPGSCSLAIRAALTLVRASFDIHTLNLSQGEHLRPDYLQLNPFGKVPALRIDDFVLTEGLAIHLYLAEQFPAAGLLPQAHPQRAEAYRWLAYLYTTVHGTFSHLFMPQRYGNDVNDIRAKAEASLFEQFALINKQLSKHDFLAGDSMSAADLYLAVALHWQGVLQGSLTDSYPALQPYIERMLAHPITGKVFRAELAQEQPA